MKCNVFFSRHCFTRLAWGLCLAAGLLAVVVEPALALAWVNRDKSAGLGQFFINGVYASGSTVYAATDLGLSISTNGGTTFTNKEFGKNMTVHGVYASGSTVYAATSGGLSISTNGGNTFTNKTTADGLGSNNVWGVYASGSTIYAATNGGLSISTDGGNTFTNKTTANGLGSNSVWGVYASGSTVYAATSSGLSISTDGGNTYTNKTTANGLGSNEIMDVYASGSTVYAATSGGLSISIDGGNTFTNKTMADGLGSNDVWGVYASDSAVYAATVHGGLSISTDGGKTFTNDTTDNGLGQNSVRDVYASDGKVYAATDNGLSIAAELPHCDPGADGFGDPISMPAITENDFAVIDQTSATFHEPVSVNNSLTKASLDDDGLTGHDWPVAVNSSGTTYGDDRVFTSSSDLAIATTNGATCVTATSAILNATVNPKSIATNVTFEYGLGKTYGNTVSIANNPVSDATNIVVSVTLNGLIPNQVYHYRVVANNAAGTTFGKDATFTTAPVAPSSQTLAATLIKQNSATLNGAVNPQNASTTVSFEYGPDKTYGEVVQYTSNPVSGTDSIPVSLTLNNLLPQQVYHYRLVATNAGGVTYGEDQTFQTILAPTAVTGAATNVHSHDVTLNATINPQNIPATVSFEYGLDDTYGETVLLPGNPLTGGENIAVSVMLDHLLPNQRYHYRVVGTSAAGSNYGADYTFTTWGNIFLPSIIR